LKIITIILIAVSLSMDAFSLALIYGTQAISKKGKILLSIIVGLYHFIMPLIGLSIGLFVTNKIIINTNILVGIILSLIAIEMIISSFKEKEEKFLLSIPGYLLFGLSVSIDSLTTGIGFSAITDKYVISALIFSVTSLLFTFLGLNLGNILNKKYGKISTIIGGSILLVIGLLYIFK
jgi:putative Mn2+ efflux pump MntP